MLWPHIFSKELEIGFAHQSFKWSNNAKGSAAVICVIVGIRNVTNEVSILFRGGIAERVKVINAYLTTGSNAIVRKRSKPLSDIPKMSYGNKPVDGGNLILSDAEKDEFINTYPEAALYIRKLIGGAEFVKGTWRWCSNSQRKPLHQYFQHFNVIEVDSI